MAEPDDRDRAVGFLNEWYPCTTLLLGERIDRAIGKFCEKSSGLRLDPAAEARDWAAVLQSEIAAEEVELRYTAEVAAYEAAIAELATSEEAGLDALVVSERNASRPERTLAGLHHVVPVAGRHVHIESYGFDIPAIVTAIQDCDRLEPVEQPTRCTVLFVRPPDQPRPRLLTVSDGIQTLLALCDGSRNAAAIVEALHARTGVDGDDDFEQRVLGALETLRTNNVLMFREPAGSEGHER